MVSKLRVFRSFLAVCGDGGRAQRSASRSHLSMARGSPFTRVRPLGFPCKPIQQATFLGAPFCSPLCLPYGKYGQEHVQGLACLRSVAPKHPQTHRDGGNCLLGRVSTGPVADAGWAWEFSYKSTNSMPRMPLTRRHHVGETANNAS